MHLPPCIPAFHPSKIFYHRLPSLVTRHSSNCDIFISLFISSLPLPTIVWRQSVVSTFNAHSDAASKPSGWFFPMPPFAKMTTRQFYGPHLTAHRLDKRLPTPSHAQCGRISATFFYLLLDDIELHPFIDADEYAEFFAMQDITTPLQTPPSRPNETTTLAAPLPNQIPTPPQPDSPTPCISSSSKPKPPSLLALRVSPLPLRHLFSPSFNLQVPCHTVSYTHHPYMYNTPRSLRRPLLPTPLVTLPHRQPSKVPTHPEGHVADSPHYPHTQTTTSWISNDSNQLSVNNNKLDSNQQSADEIPKRHQQQQPK